MEIPTGQSEPQHAAPEDGVAQADTSVTGEEFF